MGKYRLRNAIHENGKFATLITKNIGKEEEEEEEKRSGEET